MKHAPILFALLVLAGCCPSRFPTFPAPTGAACEIYGGTPFTIASHVAVDGVAADAHAVYWSEAEGVNGDGGVIRMASRTGCGPVTLVSKVAPASLVAFDHALYFIDAGYCPAGADCAVRYSIDKVPLGSGPVTRPTVLVADPGLVAPSPTLAVDASGVFWWGRQKSSTSYGIFRVPLDGGTPELVASTGYVDAIALDADAVYWTVSGTAANHFTDGAVMRVAKSGGTPMVLAHFTGRMPGSLAVRGGTVWWTSFDFHNLWEGQILSVDTSVPSPTVVDFADGQNAPWEIALDDTGVYWVNSGMAPNGVENIPKGALVGTGANGACATVTIADQLFDPVALALGGNTLAWIEKGQPGSASGPGGTVKVMGLHQ